MTATNYRFGILLLLNLLQLLLCCYSADAAAKINSTTTPCLPFQASSLLQLKRSFIIANGLSSWQAGTDCCHWEGIICDTSSGRVISLDLSEFDLMSYRLDPALFNLTSLRKLNLASIEFNFRLPASGFEQLTNITHLNFSNTYFFGQIPSGIFHLKNLVTLDFSGNSGLYFQEPSFLTFMENMSNLRELYLDWVDLSSSGSNWSAVLAHSAPQLRILSFPACGLSGSIHPSFSRLGSLTEINLGNNRLTGKVPEYFSRLSSLTTLDLSGSFFEGQFPTKIFQLKSLRKLDLSMNSKLSMRLTYFPGGNNLQNLNLAGTNFTYDTPLSFADLKSIKTLGLSTMGTTKELLALITNLPSLDVLQLRGSDLEKPELSWVGKLGQLVGLQLSYYDFSEAVPSWISNLTRLESLDLSDCTFSMPISYQIGNLAELRSLQFMDCDFSRQRIQSWIGNLTKLISLQIPGCNFSGPIPSTIGNLTQLQYLELTYNYFTGQIPESLFALPALQILYLDNNLLGSFENISTPSSSPLSLIDLSGNQLTGPIPKLLFQLTNLQCLFLSSNKLTGTIELSSIWRLKSLTDLSLYNNMISIVDREGDAIVHSLPSINSLHLASCNLTKFPAAFRYLDVILDLDLSNNQMKGAIPNWVWETWSYSLNSLDLSHNMFTTLEKSPSLVHISNLAFLDLSSNRLEGTIPIPVTRSEVIVLDYSNNSFSSIVSNFGRYLSNAIYINLSKNKLSGHIPASVCSLNKLEIMDLSYNCFGGPVPSCLIERGNLTVLKLRGNRLHGLLPKNIGEGCKLQTLDVNGNIIEGTLPTSLENCQDLEFLDIGNNHIVGSFPTWLGTLRNLRVLVLRSNQLNGTIRDLHSVSESNRSFTSLQIIDLSSNHFSGYLHSQWFEGLKSMMDNDNDMEEILGHHYANMGSRNDFYQDTITITYKNFEFTLTKIQTTLKVIDFSDNSFNGPIPKSVARLISLHGLNMSHNNFTGQIPSQLGNLTKLESMDLSCNHLSGEIPQVLTSLTFLSWLNLSYNNLTGRIPEGNQFFSFPYSSFEGNVGLCGSQVPKQCDNPGSTTPKALDHQESNSLWKDRPNAILLFTFVGLGFGVGFAFAILSRFFRRVEGWICKHFCIHMYV